jgi:hypothetical protein
LYADLGHAHGWRLLSPLSRCVAQYFYEEQLHRMECLSQEPVLFEDVLCQMHDMIQPR